MGNKTASPAYYTYDLIDPRDGSVFYVGKGKGARYLDHLKEARGGKHSAKCRRIREITGGGHDYQWRIVDSFDSETDALDAEEARIAEFGLDNLTNVLPNGYVTPARPEPTPADSARHVIDKCYAGLRRALIYKSLGLTAKIGEHDIGPMVDGLIANLREQAGDDYFDDRVGRFAFVERDNESLLSITALPEFVRAI